MEFLLPPLQPAARSIARPMAVWTSASEGPCWSKTCHKDFCCDRRWNTTCARQARQRSPSLAPEDIALLDLHRHNGHERHNTYHLCEGWCGLGRTSMGAMPTCLQIVHVNVQPCISSQKLLNEAAKHLMCRLTPHACMWVPAMLATTICTQSTHKCRQVNKPQRRHLASNLSC